MRLQKLRSLFQPSVLTERKSPAIIIGHHARAQGAFSPQLNSTEWEFYRRMRLYLKLNFTVYEHDFNISSYKNRMKDTAKEINKNNHSLIFALHFNAHSDPMANGCEALYYKGNSHSYNIAQQFCINWSKRTGIKNRGVKAVKSRHDRGFYEIYYPKAPVILLEPFFGTNFSDCKKWNEDEFIDLLNEFKNY